MKIILARIRCAALVLTVLCGCNDGTSPPFAPARVDVTPVSSSMWVGDTVRFTAVSRYADGSSTVPTPATVRWTTSDSNVLNIDASGLATAIVPLNPVYVYATISGVTGFTSASVISPRVFLVPDTNVMAVGMTRTLGVRVGAFPGPGGSDVMVTSFTSDNPSVVTTTSDGTVTAAAPGHATVSAMVVGHSTVAHAAIDVIDAPSVQFVSASGNRMTWAGSESTDNRNCGLAKDGGIYCWGLIAPAAYFDACFVRVNPAFTQRAHCSTIPLRLESAVSFTAVSSGSHGGCAIAVTKAVYCFGTNTSGELGVSPFDALKVNGGWVDHPLTAVSISEQFVAVHAMGDQHCAIRADGAAFCWGGSTSTPTRLGSGSWNTIAEQSGPAVNCGLAADSTAYCWSSTSASSVPYQVDASAHFAGIDVTLGDKYMCGLLGSGNVACWTGTASAVTQPKTSVAGSAALVFIGTMPNASSFRSRTCGVTAAGDVFCVVATGTAPTMTFALQPLDLGVKLKRFAGTCGIGLDDKAYCWDAFAMQAKLAPGQ